jgi:bifunctional DNA-binding transcriptional regulator/antitoxin component of YhaV-PrlF toxin-antitoxin module
MGSTGEHTFRGVVAESGRGGGHSVEVPFDARAEFGEARPPVEGTVNGVPLRSRLAVYGGRTYVGLTREVRAAAGIGAGDEVEVVLRRDDGAREIEVPPELFEELAAAPDARERFDGLAYTHRREYAQWINEAKREETRRDRAERAIAMLREGVRHP